MALLRSAALLVALLAAGAAAAATLPEAVQSFPDLSELATLLKKVHYCVRESTCGALRLHPGVCRAAGAAAAAVAESSRLRSAPASFGLHLAPSVLLTISCLQNPGAYVGEGFSGTLLAPTNQARQRPGC